MNDEDISPENERKLREAIEEIMAGSRYIEEEMKKYEHLPEHKRPTKSELQKEFYEIRKKDFIESIKCKDLPAEIEAKVLLAHGDCIVIERGELFNTLKLVNNNKGLFNYGT